MRQAAPKPECRLAAVRLSTADAQPELKAVGNDAGDQFRGRQQHLAAGGGSAHPPTAQKRKKLIKAAVE